MELIDRENAASYLRRTGRVTVAAKLDVERLSGGVSNELFLVTVADGPNRSQFVLKQARPQLRTPEPWFCTVERIWRETAVLTLCQQLAEPGQAPCLLFEDRQNYLFAMTAAPRAHRTWKVDLLAGVADESVAQTCGRMLGRLHAGSWRDARIRDALADRQIFDDLRLDPYYRTVARNTPDAATALGRAIDSLETNACALVHADFSPKNLLLFSGGLMLVDYETGHYGDPAFDLGFFVSHLVLKACYHAPRHAPMVRLADSFWNAYHETLAPQVSADDWSALLDRWVQHLGACLWARIDGKSQAEYLTDPARRDVAREIARALLLGGQRRWPEAVELVRSQLQQAAIR